MKKIFTILLISSFLAALGSAQAQKRKAPGFTMPHVSALHGKKLKKLKATPKSVLHHEHVTFGSRDIGALPEAVIQKFKKEDPPELQGRRVGIPRSVGNVITVAGQVASIGAWSILPDGSRIWALIIDAQGAVGLKIQFDDVALPPNATITLFDTYNPSTIAGPYTVADVHADATLFTSIVFSPSVTIECNVPVDAPLDSVGLKIKKLNHVYTGFSTQHNNLATRVAIPSGVTACDTHQDFQCHDGDNATETPSQFIPGQSVAGVSDGIIFCSGNLINDTDEATVRYFFMTANHCVSTPGTAAALEFYWFFENADCLTQDIPTDTDTSETERTVGGATFWAGSNPFFGTDCTLLELNEPAPPRATFLGWDVDGTPGGSTRIIGEQVTNISHPAGSYKRIAFGDVEAVAAPPEITGGWGSDANNIQVRYTLGLTERGSSGSPLYDLQGNYLGPLSGGNFDPSTFNLDPYCALSDVNLNVDLYGRFDVFYPLIQAIIDPAGGGGPSTGSLLAASEIWINEFSYDPQGSDLGNTTSHSGVRKEFIEIGTRAGTNLSEFELAFYDLSGVHYATYGLSNGSAPLIPMKSACDPATEAGFGVLPINMPNINHNPVTDEGYILNSGAIAIIRRSDGAVLSFISFDPTNTLIINALAGPAAGAISTNIGVHQIGALLPDGYDPEGTSLQLSGTGTNGMDFSFQPAMPMTPGSLNNISNNNPLTPRTISQSFGCVSNAAPVVVASLSTINAGILNGGASASFSIFEPEGDQVSVSLIGSLPPNAQFQYVNGQGIITFNPTLANLGNDTSVTFEATDYFGAKTLQTVQLNATIDYSADTDGDGILDAWELAECGNSLINCGQSTHLSPAPIPADLDGDGLTDYKEFVADMPAGDHNWGVYLTPEITPTGRKLSLLVSTKRHYTIEYKDSLTSDWQALQPWEDRVGAPDNPGLQRGLMTVEDNADVAHRWYRYSVDFAPGHPLAP